MAAHPHPNPRAAARPAPDQPSLGSKVLTAMQWLLVAVALFCTTGLAALLIASTPSAWPL